MMQPAPETTLDRRKPSPAISNPTPVTQIAIKARTQSGTSQIVDYAYVDQAWALKHPEALKLAWYIKPLNSGNATVYAAATVKDPVSGQRRTVYLHRLAAEAPKGVKVIAKNGDFLNCTSANLVMHRNNNTLGRLQPVVGFPYTLRAPVTGDYYARIHHPENGTALTSGPYSTAEAASEAGCQMIIKLAASIGLKLDWTPPEMSHWVDDVAFAQAGGAL